MSEHDHPFQTPEEREREEHEQATAKAKLKADLERLTAAAKAKGIDLDVEGEAFLLNGVLTFPDAMAATLREAGLLDEVVTGPFRLPANATPDDVLDGLKLSMVDAVEDAIARSAFRNWPHPYYPEPDQSGKPLPEPQARRGAVERTLLVDRRPVVTVEDLRPLSPNELATAQSFGDVPPLPPGVTYGREGLVPLRPGRSDPKILEPVDFPLHPEAAIGAEASSLSPGSPVAASGARLNAPSIPSNRHILGGSLLVVDAARFESLRADLDDFDTITDELEEGADVEKIVAELRAQTDRIRETHHDAVLSGAMAPGIDLPVVPSVLEGLSFDVLVQLNADVSAAMAKRPTPHQTREAAKLCAESSSSKVTISWEGGKRDWARVVTGLEPVAPGEFGGAKSFTGFYIASGVQHELPLGTTILRVQKTGSGDTQTAGVFKVGVAGGGKGALLLMSDGVFGWPDGYKALRGFIANLLGIES
jgi:hypothetical protein